MIMGELVQYTMSNDDGTPFVIPQPAKIIRIDTYYDNGQKVIQHM